ncbi:hypothetical protein OY671_010887, partial [Metschnikowia pulcherrima]
MGGSGRAITYRESDEASNQAAQSFRSRGSKIGDTIAICSENHPDFFSVAWGAQRAGSVYVAVSSRLTAPEIAYIAKDSGAKSSIGSDYLAPVLDEVAALDPGSPQLRFGGEGDLSAEAAFAAMPATPIADERAGCDMLYSSGTTGKPKGVRVPSPEDPAIGAPNSSSAL